MFERTFTLFWKDGSTTLITGSCYDVALKHAGHTSAYIKNLDIFAIDDVRKDWEYIPETKTWRHK